jgi:hypothetical protein
MSNLLRGAILILAICGQAEAAVCVPEHEPLEEEWIASAERATYVLVATVGRTARERSNEPEIDSYLAAPRVLPR